MKIEISTNDYKILSHGDVLLFDSDSEMKMDLEADSGFKFSIILRFINDVGKKKELKREIIDNSIVFKCVNFDDLGTGTTKPISLATINDKEWLLHFWAYKTAENGPRRIEYSILQKA